MTEPSIIPILTQKRADIRRAIVGYERALAQAKADLLNINATLSLYERGTHTRVAAYADLHKVFKRGELTNLMLKAMAEGPKSCLQVAHRVMEWRGMDPEDHVLLRSVARLFYHVATGQKRRGMIRLKAMEGNTKIWELTATPPS